MKVSHAVKRNIEIEELISEKTLEMETIVDLLSIPKYYESKSLKNRYSVLEGEVKKLLLEKLTNDKYIKEVEDTMEILELIEVIEGLIKSF